jgi:DNA-binding SARP family transcriptional activator
MDAQLELGAHIVTAILATWLGVTVVTRGRSSRASLVFAWVTLLLAAWSTAIIVERSLPGDSGFQVSLNALEDVAAFLLPAATMHIVLAFTVEARRSFFQQLALAVAYLVGALTAGQAVLDPDHPIAVDPPHLVLGGISGEALGWAFIAVRILIFGLAIWWSLRAWLAAAGDRARRGQTGAAMATVVVAAVGGTLRLLPAAQGGPKWVGVSLVTVALLLATYAVLAQGVFLSAHAARRAFRSSFLAGLAVTAYAGLVLGVQALLSRELGLELPIFTALVIAGTIAAIEPLRRWLTRIVDAPLPGHEVAYRRLARILDPGALTAQRPEVAVQPAIERVSRVLGLSGAIVVDQEGEVLAQHGEVEEPGGDGAASVALEANGRQLGFVRFGARRSGNAFSQAERALLVEAAGYIAASLDLGREQARQASELTELDTRHRAVVSQGAHLDRALTGTIPPSARLRVMALGPLHVEQDGKPVEQWGGPKAGTRQAEAVFAFLFDRGERGCTKDEIIEVVWPDVDLAPADAAFHRTLVGLRGMLEPHRAPRDQSVAIRFHNDRYRLDPSLVEWNDVDAFEDRLAAASAAGSGEAAIPELEAARALYRGEYLDDCPLYGDSEYVEERRRLLRSRYVDLLVDLGERYERRRDRPAAADAFRAALSAAGGECPPAESGLARLGSPA